MRRTGGSWFSPGSSTSTPLAAYDDHIDVTLGPGSYIMALAAGELGESLLSPFFCETGGATSTGERVLLLGERHTGRRQHRTGPRARDRHPGRRRRPRRAGSSGGAQEVANSPRWFRARIARPRRLRLPRKLMLHPFRPSVQRRIVPAPALVALAAVGATLSAQQQVVPGTNVNMVSGTTFPDGDPYLQRQNEP